MPGDEDRDEARASVDVLAPGDPRVAWLLCEDTHPPSPEWRRAWLQIGFKPQAELAVVTVRGGDQNLPTERMRVRSDGSVQVNVDAFSGTHGGAVIANPWWCLPVTEPRDLPFLLIAAARADIETDPTTKKKTEFALFDPRSGDLVWLGVNGGVTERAALTADRPQRSMQIDPVVEGVPPRSFTNEPPIAFADNGTMTIQESCEMYLPRAHSPGAVATYRVIGPAVVTFVDGGGGIRWQVSVLAGVEETFRYIFANGRWSGRT